MGKGGGGAEVGNKGPDVGEQGEEGLGSLIVVISSES